jgi:DNA invertase Pin-like site-specific DNA recombinase
VSTRAAVYARISQDRDGTGLGVNRQREDCDAYAVSGGWRIVEYYIDNDVSASTAKRRPAYQRMLSDLEANKLDAVVVWDLDRLHRRPVELERFIDLADRHGLSLGSVGGDVDLSTSAGRLHARIMGSVARHEVEHKSERQNRAAQQAAQEGRPTGGPRPFGYGRGGTTLDAAESREVRNAYAALLAGTPLREIARNLNRRGVTTTYGKQWGATQVRAVLLRARNAGLRTYRGEVIGPATWPALVDEGTWRAAVAVLSDPTRKTSPGFATRWLLSSLARCGVCGDTVSSAGVAGATRSDGSRRTVYRCRTRKHVARQAEPVDNLVSQIVVERLSRPDAAALLVDDDAPDAEALRIEAQALRIKLDTLAIEFASDSLTASQLRVATEHVRARLLTVESAQAHTDKVPVLGDVVGAEDVQEVWDGLSFDRKRAVIDALMSVTIEPEPLQGARHFRPDLVRIEWKSSSLGDG